MSSVVQITPSLNPLVELQKEFCLFTLGEVRIVNRKDITDVISGKHKGDFSIYTLSDGRVLMRRFLETLSVSTDVKNTIDDFLVSPNTPVYEKTAFSPVQMPPTTLNYWVDSPVIPSPGDWSAIEYFLCTIICDGNQKNYDYLINFLAHMLQKPEEKPGIFIVLLGGQGTGKGTFFKLLKAIWPTTTLMVSDVSHVIGQFNGAIERKYVVCMDEALFAGDRKSIDKLKSMLTEPTVTIEQKYQPRRTIDSCHRFFAASNHNYFSSVDPDDRRFLFLRVSDKYKENDTYWTELHETFDDSTVIAALVDYLRSLDLTAYNVRKRPKTDEHMQQKLRSLSGFDRYWFEVLQSGRITFDDIFNTPHEWNDAKFVSTSDLTNGMKLFFKGTRQYETTQQHVIKKDLIRLCPKVQPVRKQINGCQGRGYMLPSLQEARTDFEEIMGGKIDWPE